MEKEPNTNCMEETATMPSYFPCIKSSESHPLADWLYLKSVITSSPELRMMTETYRKRLAISKQFADQYKPEMPAITVSALMDGYGRQLANFLKPTYMLQLDFDHVKKEDMEHLIQLVRGDSHTMVEYITVSGRGFRVFCAYRPVDDDDISVLELFDAVLQKAMAYYTQLLGIAPDKQCIDITRCAGLAYDPDAYFRRDAEPFALGPKDLKPLYMKKALQAKYSARRNAKSGKRNIKVKEVAESSDQGAPTIEEAASHIKELLDMWGYRFEPEHHNEYVWHFADICIYYGIPQEEALSYADREFGSSYQDTASVVKSRYKHLHKFGIWHFYRQGEGRSGKPSVRRIKQWLLTHYLFRQNVLTGFYEVESRIVLDGKYPDWVRIDDNIENSIWSEMDESGQHLSEKTLHNIINSDFSEPFDPLDDYLRSLPKWKKGEDPDYIDQLADRIEVENLPDNEHTQSLFRYFFKKWLVAMVVAWVTLKVVNQMILIFVGKGGIFKTTFFLMLLPPQLRQYFLNDSTGAYTDKDFMEAFSSKALLCLDEFEMVFGKNLSAFKSNMTKVTFSIRRPYDKYRSEMPHRGSLCGTTNNQQFITDEENRRYCPWLVKSIESPIDHPIDYDHVFAEAVALGREVMSHPKGEPLEWTYWLTRDDIELMRSHNRLFMVANYAEEQILKYYKVPLPETPLEYIKFRYSAEILEKIGVNPALRQNLNNQNIGNVMKRLGFKKIHKKNGNGWAVIEKEGSEINRDAFIDPNDTVED